MMQISNYVKHMIEKNMDFNQFVWHCAGDIHNGATVEFYQEKLKEAVEVCQKMEEMTLTDRIAYGNCIKNDKIERYKLYAEEERFNISKCENMLSQVLDWVPPTDAHVALKDFMVAELSASLGSGKSYYDEQIKELEKMGPLEIFERDLVSAKTNILCMEENLFKEMEAAQKRNDWVDALAESVGSPYAYNH
jgi:hypothetical protein